MANIRDGLEAVYCTLVSRIYSRATRALTRATFCILRTLCLELVRLVQSVLSSLEAENRAFCGCYAFQDLIAMQKSLRQSCQECLLNGCIIDYQDQA